MELVFETRDYLEKAWKLVERIEIDASPEDQFRGAMLYSTLNICDGMQVLVQQRNFVAANVLFRALFEYVFRAYWLNRVASVRQVERAIRDDRWPQTRLLHEQITDLNSVIDVLVGEKLKVQDILHSYIHGGSQNPLGQLGHEGHIEPNIPDSEVSYLLHVIQLGIYIAVSEMVFLSGSSEFEGELVELVEAVVGDQVT